ncbi:hypothetical protein DH2020_044071 [Rehmannia glutinosa]|uniref:RING-type E3 ubiquitin transferase n=1 Tax=Rehmannia glutinosa TaxID=99300 RepID=A0ABR0UI73_REHGL
MAKSGVLEGDPTMVAKAMELKKELQKLVKAIVDEEDVNLEAIDRAQKMMCALKELKLKKSVSLKLHNHHYGHEMVSGTVPEEFKCPLSKELMRDPVIIASGQTFDRPFIQKWLKSGNRTCPQTQQVLSHTILTPNHLIREMIAQWCKNHGIKLPDSIQYSNEEGVTKADRDYFLSLLKKMSSTLSDQKEAAKEMRLLTKRMPSFRALFGESLDAIPKLLSPISQSKCEREFHPDLQEDIITTLLNLSIHDNNKKLVAETPMVIPLLVNALKSGTIETRSNAAAALFTLSALDSNKALIGKSGALKPLIDLLDEGHPLAMKDVASAIFNLCIIHDNKSRAVRDGAVRVILKKITSRMHVDELLSIVAMLSTSQKAIEEMVELDAVPCLLSIIRESCCARNKENCIAILYTICFSDRSKLKEMREEEIRYRTISQLAQNGTSRAKRKASGILERMNRAVNVTHTA